MFIPKLFFSFFKVIPQKLKLPMNVFETFPECSLPNTVLKNTIKMIGHHARLGMFAPKNFPCTDFFKTLTAGRK